MLNRENIDCQRPYILSQKQMLIYLNQWHPISLKCMRNKDMKTVHFNISTFNHYKTVMFVFIKIKKMSFYIVSILCGKFMIKYIHCIDMVFLFPLTH